MLRFFTTPEIRPLHPFGPSIGPCGDPACTYCTGALPVLGADYDG